MLGINCIKLIFGYLYFSPNTFPKIKQRLGGQLEIRLNESDLLNRYILYSHVV